MKEFLQFQLDDVNQCLWKRGDNGEAQRILLTPKVFGVLHYLVEHAGRLVTHDELLNTVWLGTHVQPQAVKKLIVDVRTALQDRAKNPQFIETLYRRGYRFIAPVREGNGSQTISAIPLSPSKLVGREGVQAELHACLGKALRGERQIVFITGEPGIGKTALMDKFERQAGAEVQGIRIARGQCVEGYGGHEAYYPMLDALGQLCRDASRQSVVETLASQAPTWLVQFPALVKHGHRETLQREIMGATRERMLREVADALEAISSSSHLLLLLEDLQWVDYATTDLISALARRRTSAKLMLIGAMRPLDVAHPQHPLMRVKDELLAHGLCSEIALQPLQEADIVEYLAVDAPDVPLPEGLAELLYNYSEGNPLFMMAALEHLTGQGLISHEGGGWRLSVPLREIALEVPHKLRGLIEAQIAQLSEEEQRMLEVASVEGRTFSATVSGSIANLDAERFEEDCQRMSLHQIVRPVASAGLSDEIASSRYEFVHALYRETCYRRQLPKRRATLHQRIGERLAVLFAERPGDVASNLSYHFEASGDWPRAVKYLRVTAEIARHRYANREATAILRHALDVCSKLTEDERASNEIEILESLGMIYTAHYDPRATESFETMASRAAQHGRIDVETRALIGLAIPLSWTSLERCLEVLERALVLSEGQTDPLLRTTSRMTCYFFRTWLGGWNARDAEECRNMLGEIRELGNQVTRSRHLAQYSLLQWASSEYREADLNLSEAVSTLLESNKRNHVNLSLIYWNQQLFSSTSLVFLGKWGQAFDQFRAGIATSDKNGDEYRASLLRLYMAWAHLHAMDFETVLRICDSVFSHPGKSALNSKPDPSIVLPEQIRLCLILKGSAQLGLGNHNRAMEHLLAARNAMDQQMVIKDWYWRMSLESALTEVWLARGELTEARSQAERFLNVTLSTQERTWQALAWEACARVAITAGDFERAHDCVAKALQTMESFEVPLAEWRVHATAAQLYESGRDWERAERHRGISRTTILRLANSLESGDPLQTIFLSAPPIRKILKPSRGNDDGGHRSRRWSGTKVSNASKRSTVRSRTRAGRTLTS